MFDRCITCDRLGHDCVPNLFVLDFADLLAWCKKRQKHLSWSNQDLADKSNIPVGTINRIKSGEEDCRYSTMRHILHALMGGYALEFPCQKVLDQEFAAIETLKLQNEDLACKNSELVAKLAVVDELHRGDVRAILETHREEISLLREDIAFLKEQLRAWQRHCGSAQ